MKIKKSEAFRIASRIVLEAHPISSDDKKDIVLDILSILRNEEETALMLEAVAEKEGNNETL